MQMRHNIGNISRAFGLAGDSATKMGGKIKAAAASGASSMGRMGGAISSVRSLFAGLVISFVGFEIVNTIRQWTNEIIEFEQEFANVRTLLDEAIVPIPLLRKQVLALGGTLGKTTDLTQGLYQAISAGVEPAQAVRFVGVAAMFARGALTDTRTAVDVLTTAINAYGREAKDAADISDVLFETIKLGKTTGEELAGTLGRVIPTAALLSVSLRELGAVIATLTAGGLDTNEAVTAVNQTLLTFIRPTEGAKLAAKGLGFELTGAAVRSLGFVGALKLLEEKLGGNSDKAAILFRNVRSLRAVLPLTTTLSAKLAVNLEKMGDVAGNSAEAFAVATEVFKVQFEAALTNIQKLFIGVSTEIGFVTLRLIEFNEFMERGVIPVNAYTIAIRAMVLAFLSLIFIKVGIFIVALASTLITATAMFTAAEFAAIGFGNSLLFLVSIINVTLATSVVELIFKLTLLKSLLIFVGGAGVAAFIGWQIGTLIKDFVGLNEETENFIQKFAAFFNIQREVVSETNSLAEAIFLNNILFEQYGEKVDRAGKSTSEFVNAVNMLGLSLQKTNAVALEALGTWVQNTEILDQVTDKQKLLDLSIRGIRNAVNDAVLSGLTWEAALKTQRDQIADVNNAAKKYSLIISALGLTFLPAWTESAATVNAELEKQKELEAELTKAALPFIEKIGKLRLSTQGLVRALEEMISGEEDLTIVSVVLEKEILGLKEKTDLFGISLDEQILKLIADTVATKEAAEAKKDLQKEVKKVIDEFNKGLNPLGEFTDKLRILKDAGKDTEEMLLVYGEAIDLAVFKSIAAGISVSGLALKFALLARSIKLSKEALEDFSLVPLPETVFPSGVGPGFAPPGVIGTGLEEGVLDPDNIKTVTDFTKEIREAFDAASPEALGLKLVELGRIFTALNTRVDAGEILLEAYGDETLAIVKAAEKWGLVIPPIVKELAEMQREINENAAAAKRWEKIWTQAMGRVVRDFARGIADIIVGFRGFSDGFIRLVKQTGRTFVETVIITWFEPFNEQFRKWGEQLGVLLNEIFNEVINPFLKRVGRAIGGFFANLLGIGGGGGGGGVGGIINQIGGGIIGGQIAGLFGGGGAIGSAALGNVGTVAVSGIGPFAPTIGIPALPGGGAVTGGGIASQIIPFLTNPITIAVAAAIAAAFLIWRKFFKKDAFESGAKEVFRDFGINVSKETIKGFTEMIGLTKKQFEGVRKDIESSPLFFKNILLPAAKASGTVDQLIARYSRLQAFGQTFDFGAAAAAAATGDYSLLNKQWIDLFRNSTALAEVLPDFVDKLAVPLGGVPGFVGDTGSIPGLEDVANLLNRAFAVIFENFEEFLSKLNLIVARLREVASVTPPGGLPEPTDVEMTDSVNAAEKEDLPEFQEGGIVTKGGLGILDTGESVLPAGKLSDLLELLKRVAVGIVGAGGQFGNFKDLSLLLRELEKLKKEIGRDIGRKLIGLNEEDRRKAFEEIFVFEKNFKQLQKSIAEILGGQGDITQKTAAIEELIEAIKSTIPQEKDMVDTDSMEKSVSDFDLIKKHIVESFRKLGIFSGAGKFGPFDEEDFFAKIDEGIRKFLDQVPKEFLDVILGALRRGEEPAIKDLLKLFGVSGGPFGSLAGVGALGGLFGKGKPEASSTGIFGPLEFRGLFNRTKKRGQDPAMPAPFSLEEEAPRATGGGPIPTTESGQRITIKIENSPTFEIHSRSEDLVRTARTEVFPLFIRMMQKNVGGAIEDLIRAIEQNKQGVTARKL